MAKRVVITIEQIVAAVEADDMIGFCTRCGNEQGNVEPDARGMTCEACDEPAVKGAEQLMLERVA